GLEVVDFHEETGIDRLVEFVLRGQPGDVDKALATAQVTPLKEGISIYQPPLPGFDPSKLSNPRSGEDQRKSSTGQTVHRLFVRGGTPEGPDVIHVWAFTT